jgi:hypothetical protein
LRIIGSGPAVVRFYRRQLHGWRIQQSRYRSSPLLEQEGRTRGRGGHSGVTTPSALLKELRDIFLMRSHPSCPRRGLRYAWFSFALATPCCCLYTDRLDSFPSGVLPSCHPPPIGVFA